MTDKAPYSYSLLAEAACCMWEAVSEWRYMALSKPQTSLAINSILERLDHIGIVAMRHDCIDLAETCCLAWDALSEDEQQSLIPYDWEFCPTFLLCVDWERYSGVTVTGADFSALVARLRDAAARGAKRQSEEARR